ncbi:unnamed protein product [Adineta ricciae]|uniref:CHHC U11-48K-type domain-containing protein n=1 Tax=Adineta ricciae TaxID=249248 RepID=A0A813MQZ7_ADIRI|nr:unnamed protein product [Adineta ricciae]
MSSLYLCPDDFWRCPIDLNHQVLAKRFPYHIRRCLLANPHIRRVRCVFNANHLTTPQDLLHHMSTCPDAISRTPGRPWSDDCHRSSAPTNWQMFRDVNATEDWDDDIRERQTRNSILTFSEQPIVSPSNQESLSSPILEHATEKKYEEVANYSCNDVLGKIQQEPVVRNNYRLSRNTKQAHVFEEHDNDGQIHPVETDDITKSLMKIRTLQLIGGAGRGTCCLLRTSPSASSRLAR